MQPAVVDASARGSTVDYPRAVCNLTASVSKHAHAAPAVDCVCVLVIIWLVHSTGGCGLLGWPAAALVYTPRAKPQLLVVRT